MWRVWVYGVIFLALGILPKWTIAQTLTVTSFNVDEGLAQSAVNDILQGPEGYYWFGTQDGLSQFDGYHFRTFSSVTHPQILNNYVTRIVPFGDRAILFGTLNGLYFLDVRTEAVSAVQYQQKGLGHVHDVMQVPEGWLVAVGDKLILLNKDLTTVIKGTSLNKAPPKIGVNLFRFSGKSYFITRQNKIAAVDVTVALPNSFSVINQSDGTLLHDTLLMEAEIWLATNRGVWRLNQSEAVQVIEGLDARVIAFDHEHRLWLAGIHGLYYAKVDKRNEPLKANEINTDSKQSDVLTSNTLLKLYVDKAGLLWLGSLNKGVAIHSVEKEWFENHSTASSELPLPSDDVLSIAVDENDIWVATANGVLQQRHARGDKYSWYRIDNEPAFYGNRVNKVLKDMDGNIWLGFNRGGLAYRSSDSPSFERIPLLGLTVQTTDFLEMGPELLVSTRDHGLFVVNRATKIVTHVDKSNAKGLTTNRLQSLYQGADGRVWIGGFDSGVFVWHRQQGYFEPLIEMLPSLPNALYRSVIVDLSMVQDQLWLATSMGLFMVDIEQQKTVHLSTRDGLPSEVVYTVLPDRQGNVWLPTNKGLVSYEPESGRMTTYNKEDGLINSEYNANAFAIGADGRFWAGGIAGLTVYRPELRSVSQVELSPKLADVRLFNQTLKPEQRQRIWQREEGRSRLRFGPEHPMFSVYFSVLRPELSNQVQYRYQLVGFDQQWLTLERGQNFATYTNLSPGVYQLQFSAAVGAGAWSDVELVDVIIKPPLWLSVQAKFTYLLVVMLLLSLFFNLWRSKRRIEIASFKQTKQNEERLKLSMHTSGSLMWELNLAKQELQIIDYQPTKPSAVTIPFEQNVLAEYLHEDDAKALVERLKHGPYDSEMFDYEFIRFKDENGQLQWMRGTIIVSELDDEGEVQALLGVSTNVDELKNTQLELKKLNQELEDRVISRTRQLNSSNRDLKITLDNLRFAQEELLESQKMASLGAMVAGISHEINTPLGICVTAISHMSSKLDAINKKFEARTLNAKDFAQFQQESAHSFELLQNNIHRAAELISSFKQVSVEQSTEEKREFDLRQLLEDSLNTLMPKFNDKGISASIECSKELEMDSFPGAISQIVINLAMNALTHGFEGRSGGNIRILVSDILDEYDEVLLIFGDDGKGIEESKLSRIFEPFYTSNRGGGNTGLGMHITYNLIVQKLKGAVAINSLPDTGAEFYIRLPKKIH